MPLDLNEMRAEFARFLHTDPKTRWRLDAALAHVLTIAYTRGLADGERSTHDPFEIDPVNPPSNG